MLSHPSGRGVLGVVTATSVLLGLLAYNAFARPIYDWDMIAYVGVVYSMTESDPVTIQAKTYAEVKQSVSESGYQALSAGSEYKTAVANRPELFVQQLPFYSVKPAYPALMLVLHKIGINLVAAGLAISRIAYVLTGVLLFFWILRYHALPYALLVAALLVSLPFFVSLPRMISPDALSTLFFLCAFFLLIERKNVLLSLLVAVLAITVRPDNILLAGLLFVFAFTGYPQHRVWYAASLAAGVGLYLVQVNMSGNYGWQTLMYHSFVNFLSEPAKYIPSLSFVDYLRIYYRAIAPETLFEGTASGSSYSIMLFVLLNVVTLVARYTAVGRRDVWTGALFLNLLFISAHWIVMPGDKDRVIVGSFMVILMAIIATAGSNTTARAVVAPTQSTSS